ncbi:MAG: succinate dehydrogenase/fumarate reductase iron-sulfur subunit [Gemmatimonadetes bacterium]|nr:MAG: succinate dehydrogenase/fumarate reductase iron-sulfur subunit [Gemmatimonadota bacterium]
MSSNGNLLQLKLRVWRQKGPDDAGKLVEYQLDDVSPDMSFLEMLDHLNAKLILEGQEPIAFEHDCREGICGACGAVVNGMSHGQEKGTTLCQLHMRKFRNGETITIEPFRASAFPIIKDLVVDRSAFDQIIRAGGYISVNTGNAPDANAIPIGKDKADLAFDAATCIGCGACVAACPNASAMLFLSAKVSQFALLPQGRPEAARRVKSMVAMHDELGFGSCTNHGECSTACPKEISLANIARLNREFAKSLISV